MLPTQHWPWSCAHFFLLPTAPFVCSAFALLVHSLLRITISDAFLSLPAAWICPLLSLARATFPATCVSASDYSSDSPYSCSLRVHPCEPACSEFKLKCYAHFTPCSYIPHFVHSLHLSPFLYVVCSAWYLYADGFSQLILHISSSILYCVAITLHRLFPLLCILCCGLYFSPRAKHMLNSPGSASSTVCALWAVDPSFSVPLTATVCYIYPVSPLARYLSRRISHVLLDPVVSWCVHPLSYSSTRALCGVPNLILLWISSLELLMCLYALLLSFTLVERHCLVLCRSVLLWVFMHALLTCLLRLPVSPRSFYPAHRVPSVIVLWNFLSGCDFFFCILYLFFFSNGGTLAMGVSFHSLLRLWAHFLLLIPAQHVLFLFCHVRTFFFDFLVLRRHFVYVRSPYLLPPLPCSDS